MIGEVGTITIFGKDIKDIKEVKEGVLKENSGLVGDIYSKGGEKQISFFSEEGRNKIETQGIEGICTKRFYENITIKNLHLKNLQIGSLIKIEESILEVSHIGKECFPDCNLLKIGKFCPLAKDVIFAKVIKGGVIRNGDKIIHV